MVGTCVYVWLMALVVSVYAGNQKYTPAELKQMLLTGFGNVERETIDGDVTVDYGTVPRWLDGDYMRHACGAFGETAHQNEDAPNFVEHLFDCMEIGSKFSLHNGTVTFTNRWYDTTTRDIYKLYGQNMNKSSVFFPTTYSKMNESKIDLWRDNMSDVTRVAKMPSVSWWKIGDDAIAMTESPVGKYDVISFCDVTRVSKMPSVSWWKIGDDAIAMMESPVGVVIDTETVTQQGPVNYTDDEFGYPASEGWMYTNNPAHEQVEENRTLWSTVGVYKFTNRTNIMMKRLIYKVRDDLYRHVVGVYNYSDIDLTRCQGNRAYPDPGGRLGYLHSFCMTENYVILPETAYMFDPCVMTHYDKYTPFFLQGFTFEDKAYSRLVVMRKSDGAFVATIKAQPFFATHQLGSYEEGHFIYMDMLLYDDASIYDKHTYVNNMIGDNYFLTNVSRITIDTRDWSATIRNLRNDPPAQFEMSVINFAYSGRRYTYAYMVKNFDNILPNAITKLNVDTGFEVDYTLADGLFVQEPQYVARPNATDEDDGVLLAQGLDGPKKKAFLVIIDAHTMTLISHVTAPDFALFGIHERFYHSGGTRITRPGNMYTAVLGLALVLCYILNC